MKKNFVSVVFDRRKQLASKGTGNVELLICLSRNQKKYVVLKNLTESLWERYKTSKELEMEIETYNTAALTMKFRGIEMTVENLNSVLGLDKKKDEEASKKATLKSEYGFIDFMETCIKDSKLSSGTMKHKQTTVKTLKAWGQMNRFRDVTVANVVAFDKWLKEDGTRTDVTVNNYHKVLKVVIRSAYNQGLIKENPYTKDACHFSRGKSKERRPLSEDELVKLRNLNGLSSTLDIARDYFVFCVYTGLSFVDYSNFDFKSMAELHDDTYFIDGQRVKTGGSFYTPILPPAIEVLKKYNFELPKISNQKLNSYLHLLEEKIQTNKPMTCHVARHSFATLLLSYDTPMADVAKMLGHANIKTTQIYAKVLHNTIERHGRNLANLIK